MLAGLKPGTNYFYKVISKNASGKAASRDNFEFNTLYEEKKLVKAPVISDVAVSRVGTSTVSITWLTNVGTGGEVRYGTTTAYRKTDGGHVHSLTAHVHALSGLLPDTLYHFVAIVRDLYGNETIYEDKTFRTLADSSAAAAVVIPPAEQASESAEPVTDETTVLPAASGGGGGGGGSHSYTPTMTLAAPRITRAKGLDRQVMFVWDKRPLKKTAPGSAGMLTNIVIVRTPAHYSSNPLLGRIVYKGNSGLFTDTNLENGKTYFYSVFTVNQFNSYSQPTRFTIVPARAEEEMELEAVPSVIQKTPIYTFTEKLKKGDKNKDVEHLQVLLASEPAIYPEAHITGYFGQATERAVRALQRRYKITPSGVADAPTLKKLEALSAVEVAGDKAAVFDRALSRDLTLGSQGGDVSVLQQFLINSGVYPEALITGSFGPLTLAALARFQKQQNISPSSGYFGPLTKKRMLNLIRVRSISF